jgi:hypothetical protein
MDWIYLAQDRNQFRASYAAVNLQIPLNYFRLPERRSSVKKKSSSYKNSFIELPLTNSYFEIGDVLFISLFSKLVAMQFKCC